MGQCERGKTVQITLKENVLIFYLAKLIHVTGVTNQDTDYTMITGGIAKRSVYSLLCCSQAIKNLISTYFMQQLSEIF